MDIVKGLLLGSVVGFLVYFVGCVILTLVKKHNAKKLAEINEVVEDVQED